jgi:carbamate kinase
MGQSILIALGGNALLPAGSSGTIAEQRAITLRSLAPVVEALGDDDRLLITHGNGPVVGNILIRNAAAAREIPPMPVDVCDADSQGGLGYMIAQSLGNALREAGKPRPVAAVITRVRVDADDPALLRPTKPIGPFYPEARAHALAAENGWVVRDDAGRGWRRLIGSPTPREILELPAIAALLEAGQVVIAVGGGGVPVTRDADGREIGVEAVIDKDRASALLAAELGVDRFLVITGVDRVVLGFGTNDERPLDRMTVAEARRHMEAGEFGEGSMKPKIEAALSYLERVPGGEVRITSPEEIGAALRGEAGTAIVP